MGRPSRPRRPARRVRIFLVIFRGGAPTLVAMTIWILALVLVAITVSAGYAQGAIRVGFSLLGIVAGMVLALPLAPMVVPFLPFVGITSSWAHAIIAPIVAFFLVGVAFKIGGNFVHRKVEYHYKYRTSDGQRALWERMNRRLGAAVGSIGGVIYFLLACLLVSTLGYFTIQVGGAESESKTLSFLTRMAMDARETHMDKVVGGMNPAPESFFEMSDFVGFLVQNRDTIRRVRTYPPMFAKGSTQFLDGDSERGKGGSMRAVVDDTDYFRMLTNERDPAVILRHARTQEMMTNAEIRTFLASLDLNDLMAYLKTGKSPKYAEERLIGIWNYNFPASVVQAKKEKPEMLASEMIKYNREMRERYESAQLVATLDNVISLKLPSRMEGSLLPSMTNAPPRVSYTGQWRRSGSAYNLELRARGGARVETSPATVTKIPGRRSEGEGDRVTFKLDQKTVCFDRIPE
jgi:hypothetical protein